MLYTLSFVLRKFYRSHSLFLLSILNFHQNTLEVSSSLILSGQTAMHVELTQEMLEELKSLLSFAHQENKMQEQIIDGQVL